MPIIGPGKLPTGGSTADVAAKKSTTPIRTGVGTNISSVDLGTQDIAAQALSVAPGIVAFSFYSATNASGAMLRPGAASAIGVTVPFRGSVVALSLATSGSASGIYTATGGASVTLAAGTSAYQAFPVGEYSFEAGDKLDVTASGVSGSVAIEVILFVIQNKDSVL